MYNIINLISYKPYCAISGHLLDFNKNSVSLII